MNKINDPKRQALIAIKKAQSHLKKVRAMLEEDQYCISVMEQMLATTGLLKSAQQKILQNHLNSCFVDGMQEKDEHGKKQLIEEVLNVISLSQK